MTTLYDDMKRYNPRLTREKYQSLIDALRAKRDLLRAERELMVWAMGV